MSGSEWTLPGYVVQRRLGAGGSGEVWLARPRSGGAAVAVKVLPALGREQLAAVRSEAALLSGLDHPHLLHLHEVVPCKRGLALVLDLAGGGSLAALLAARGRLAPGEVVTAIAPTGAALAYAHNAGVVHGDVSAANLLFTDIGLPLLADLGVARLVGDDAPVRSTPAYVDPAVAAGGVPAASSDVFMLGAVALHALTGDPPWPGGSAAEALAAAAAGDIGDVAARLAVAGVPDEVAEVVARALDFDADRRPTAAEFALDLRHAAEPVAVELDAGRERVDAPTDDRAAFTHIVRAAPRRPLPTRRRARLLRSPRLVAVVGAGLVALLVAAAVLWWPRGDSRHAGAVPPTPSPSSSGTGTTVGTLPDPTPSDSVTTHSGPVARPGPTLTAASAGRVLAELDAVRSRAFADRDPSLLSRVYVAGALRNQDAATITRIVPAGCGLIGVRTVYTDIAVTSRTAARTGLRVRARLQPSTLECGGTASGRAPGAPEAVLRIVLVRTGGRYLIGAITGSVRSGSRPSPGPRPGPDG